VCVRTGFQAMQWNLIAENPVPEGTNQLSPARQRWERLVLENRGFSRLLKNFFRPIKLWRVRA